MILDPWSDEHGRKPGTYHVIPDAARRTRYIVPAGGRPARRFNYWPELVAGLLLLGLAIAGMVTR